LPIANDDHVENVDILGIYTGVKKTSIWVLSETLHKGVVCRMQMFPVLSVKEMTDLYIFMLGIKLPRLNITVCFSLL